MGSLARKMHRNSIKGKSHFGTLSRHPRPLNIPDFSYRVINKEIDEKVTAQVAEVQRKEREKHLKGIKGGNCNRTDCQKPHAIFFHHSTRLYYCGECAHMLNRVNYEDSMRLYQHALVQVDLDAYQDLLAHSLLPGKESGGVHRALRAAEALKARGEILR